MAIAAPALSGALADIVGRAHVSTEPAVLDTASVDGVRPRWIARAGSADDVSRLLALASSERLAVAPRGSGSSVALGNPPRRLDLVLDLSRLVGVTDYVPADMVASVEAGTALDALQARLSREGQRLALDPVRGRARTVGGVLATHASGPLRFRYGTGRDLLLGVRFVQADGTITWGGSRVVKSVTGYDVPKLLVGSLGTLGVIVGATLRLHPTPPATGSWLCAFDSAAATRNALAVLLASPIEPERVAMLNGVALRAGGWASEGPALLVGVGSVEEAVRTQGAALADSVRREGGRIEHVPSAGWARLDSALDAPVVVRIAGQVRRAVDWLRRAEDLASRARLEMACVGQAGNGVLHVALRGVTSGPALEQGMLGPLRQELGDEGGSAIVERAPHELKADLDVWGPVPAESLAIMARLKREFDPEGVLNPGRFAGGL